jgi:BirA family biotin operon repressor/biotin-[acetyl-CoA-carboxylase] ligase
MTKNRLSGTPLPDGAGLFTCFQKAGKGQGNHSWHGQAGKNILVSFYFSPTMSIEQQFLFNMAFSLGVRAFVSRYIVSPVKIKWANDIYVNHRKIAGILISHHWQQGKTIDTIAGVGININQDRFPENLPNPTSLLAEDGVYRDILLLLLQLQKDINVFYQKLKQGEVEALKAEYSSYLYGLNEWHPYLIRGEKTEARVLGVDDFGRLSLETIHGALHFYDPRDIQYLYPVGRVDYR